MATADLAFTQPLYDTVRLDPGDTSDLFQEPVGAGQSLFGGGPKTLADTNLVLSGRMPPGTSFVVRSIYFEPLHLNPEAATTLPEWMAFMTGATFDVILGARSSLQLPASRIRTLLTVSDANLKAALELARAIKDINPSAVAWLLGTMPGISFGFDLENNKLVLTPQNLLRVVLTRPVNACNGMAVRFYLNGTLKRPAE